MCGTTSNLWRMKGFWSGNDSPDDVAALLNQLADVRFAQSKFDYKTEALYQRAIELFESVNGAVHADVANVLGNPGFASPGTGQLQGRGKRQPTRRRHYRRNLQHTRFAGKLRRGNRRNIVLSIHRAAISQLSSSLCAQGRYGPALALARETFGPHCGEHAESLNNPGYVCTIRINSHRIFASRGCKPKPAEFVQLAKRVDPTVLSPIAICDGFDEGRQGLGGGDGTGFFGHSVFDFSRIERGRNRHKGLSNVGTNPKRR